MNGVCVCMCISSDRAAMGAILVTPRSISGDTYNMCVWLALCISIDNAAMGAILVTHSRVIRGDT